MKKSLLLFLLTICFSNLFTIEMNAESADYKYPFQIGIWGSGNINMHAPNFNDSLLLNPTQILFDQNATGLSFGAGLFVGFPIVDNIAGTVRLGYNGLGAKLESDTFNIESSLSAVELSLGAQFYNVIPVDRMYILAGLEFGIPLESDSYTAHPKNTTISDQSFRVAPMLGLGMTFDLSKNVHLSPEISYRLALSDVSSRANYNSWSVSQLRAGVALTFSFDKDEEVKVNPESQLSVGFEGVYAYDNAGTRTTATKIKVEDVQYVELYPLVPYVFFDENAKTPNLRFQSFANESETGVFALENLEANAMQINKSTLDIIGTRMKANPNAIITLTGTNDGKTEKNSKGLTQSRAEFARDYLVTNYNVNASKIKVEAGSLPKNAATSREKDGLEENRRVEISSDYKEILEPLMIQKEKQTYTEPRILEFVPNVNSTDSITSWELEITQSDRVIEKYSGSGTFDNPITWQVLPNQISSKEIPVEYTLYVTNAGGKKETKSGSIPVEYLSLTNRSTEVKPDKTISKYSLMLFDFDSEKISERDKDIIDNKILSSIKYNSIVQIYGYTDRIGDAEYNKRLSIKRAEEVKKYLESKAKSAKYEVYGTGESIQIFDNNSPIGRNLSRTVQVYVITPKEK